MKLRFELVLLALVLAYALLKFSDGIGKDDWTAIFVMFSFCTVILIFSGANDIEGVVVWFNSHRSQTMYLLFFFGFVSVTALWNGVTNRIPFTKTAEIVLSAAFFFTAIVVVAAWVSDKFSAMFRQKK